MIEKRHKSFVTTNGLVPVDNICNKIGTGKTIEMLLQMYPKLTKEDIFEAVHFYADNTSIPSMDTDKLLKVENTGTQDEIVIEVTNLNQIVYIKLLSVGHEYYKEIEDFSRLMNQGLFPLSLSIGSRCVAWRTDDISKWNKKLGGTN